MSTRLQPGVSKYFSQSETGHLPKVVITGCNNQNELENEKQEMIQEEDIVESFKETFKKNQTNITIGVIVGVVAISSITYFFIKRAKDKKKELCSSLGYQYKENMFTVDCLGPDGNIINDSDLKQPDSDNNGGGDVVEEKYYDLDGKRVTCPKKIKALKNMKKKQAEDLKKKSKKKKLEHVNEEEHFYGNSDDEDEEVYEDDGDEILEYGKVRYDHLEVDTGKNIKTHKIISRK